jgi:hypothetical protein
VFPAVWDRILRWKLPKTLRQRAALLLPSSPCRGGFCYALFFVPCTHHPKQAPSSDIRPVLYELAGSGAAGEGHVLFGNGWFIGYFVSPFLLVVGSFLLDLWPLSPG